MGKFLTSPALTEQLPKKGMYKLELNELYKDDDGTINLHWRGFETDNFTWIKSNNWDTRCSHGHDIGCKYGKIVKVKLTEEQLKSLGFLCRIHNKIVCKDIPIKYLEVVDISGHEINNLFFRMLRDADCPKTPKIIQYFYRAGVCLNFNWFLHRKDELILENLYGSDDNNLFYREGCNLIERASK